MTDEQLYFHLLNKITSANHQYLKKIAKICGSAKSGWLNLNKDILYKIGLSNEKIEQIIQKRKEIIEERELAYLASENISIMTCSEAGYPALLKQLYDYPVVLYAKGDISLLNSPCLAIVGSRKHTIYGELAVQSFIPTLINNGITIVSGMAYGIDSLAHRKTLELKGKTLAVLGCSVDYIYPQENYYIYQQIGSTGLLLSEFPPRSKPERHAFPMRNRIISGLSLGTFIVEAREKSGALITARLANEQGREVFALPGSIHNTYIKGNHQLLSNNEACLVQSPEEIIERLLLTNLGAKYLQSRKKNQSIVKAEQNCTELEQKILTLTSEPIAITDLQNQTGFEISELSQTITLMEIKGILKSCGGGKVIKIQN